MGEDAVFFVGSFVENDSRNWIGSILEGAVIQLKGQLRGLRSLATPDTSKLHDDFQNVIDWRSPGKLLRIVLAERMMDEINS